MAMASKDELNSHVHQAGTSMRTFYHIENKKILLTVRCDISACVCKDRLKRVKTQETLPTDLDCWQYSRTLHKYIGPFRVTVRGHSYGSFSM